jgi:hypothetical protein
MLSGVPTDMAETVLNRALTDIKKIRNALEIVTLLGDDEQAIDTQAWIVFDARKSLLKHLNASLPLVLGKLDQLFKGSALLLITPGVQRGFIDSTMKVDVFREVALSEGVEIPGGERYAYRFTRDIDLLTIGQMSDEQMYALFLADIIENASNDGSYKNRLDFDRNVAEKYIALLYAIEVARRLCRSREWPSAGDDEPPSAGGRPDTGGGSGVPIVPLTPALIGGAANEIPREEE